MFTQVDSSINYMIKKQNKTNAQGGLVFLLLALMIKLAQLSQKRPEILAFEGHKGRKAKKGQEGQKNKYGSKCLELSNSARNAKIAKNFQKVPKAWRSMDIRPNGLWSWNYIYIYVRNIMLIFIHHNLLNTIFRKKTNSGYQSLVIAAEMYQCQC